MSCPKFHEFMQPVITAIYKLGGTATTTEIYENVAADMQLSDETLQEMMRNGTTSVVKDRLSWARDYLKRAGIISSSSRGVWYLNNDFRNNPLIDSQEIVRSVRRMRSTRNSSDLDTDRSNDTDEWKENLLSVIRLMHPSAFERLCQRILRELGFVEVTVTGHSGDGGIDGRGVFVMQEIIGFQMIFQCKKYAANRKVDASEVRNFRGSMTGRTDKGLYITTSSFTREAIREATREGTFQIDLVDGERLAEILARLNLGVETRTIIKYNVIPEWFSTI